jgi:hypothetical protein
MQGCCFFQHQGSPAGAHAHAMKTPAEPKAEATQQTTILKNF